MNVREYRKGNQNRTEKIYILVCDIIQAVSIVEYT